MKPARLDSEEQAKIAKAGLEMKRITSEMDAETEKWQENGSALEENNDIVKRAKNMSSMAFSMYQFTRGEGALKTTQDLFTQAEYFAEEANRLYKVVRQFSYQVRSADSQFARLLSGIVLNHLTNCFFYPLFTNSILDLNPNIRAIKYLPLTFITVGLYFPFFLIFF